MQITCPTCGGANLSPDILEGVYGPNCWCLECECDFDVIEPRMILLRFSGGVWGNRIIEVRS